MKIDKPAGQVEGLRRLSSLVTLAFILAVLPFAFVPFEFSLTSVSWPNELTGVQLVVCLLGMFASLFLFAVFMLGWRPFVRQQENS